MQRLELDRLDFADIVRKGDLVLWGQGCGEPQSLAEALLAQRHSIGAFTVLLGTSFSPTVQPEHADVVTFLGIAGTGSARRLTKAGAIDILPIHMTTLDETIRSRRRRVDVALVQVSHPDAYGRYSLGLASDYIRTAIDSARVVVAEVNERVPFTMCEEPLQESDFDYIVETSRLPLEVAARTSGEVESRIAKNVGAFVPERATLQVGLGNIPEAILAGLADHRGLGIHSAVIGDRVADLMQAGAVTNEHKEIDRGVSVTCLLIGTSRLYGFVDRNPSVLMAPIRHTHASGVVGHLRRFVALNSAIEVDLTGQVNSEAIGDDYFGLVGGQVEYMRAANSSEGGCAIIALPSTASSGAVSRIVDRLSGPVTTARSDVGVVVTENGVADLRGASIRERVTAMLGLVHPAHREALEQRARAILRTRG